MLATLVVAEAARSSMRSCKDFKARGTLMDRYWRGECTCPPEEYAMGDGCGKAWLHEKFRFDEVEGSPCRGLRVRLEIVYCMNQQKHFHTNYSIKMSLMPKSLCLLVFFATVLVITYRSLCLCQFVLQVSLSIP